MTLIPALGRWQRQTGLLSLRLADLQNKLWSLDICSYLYFCILLVSQNVIGRSRTGVVYAAASSHKQCWQQHSGIRVALCTLWLQWVCQILAQFPDQDQFSDVHYATPHRSDPTDMVILISNKRSTFWEYPLWSFSTYKRNIFLYLFRIGIWKYKWLKNNIQRM